MPGKIFVNYRRDDVPGDARGVRDGLAAKFGKSSIFMDVDNLLVGQRFDIELGKALDDCDLLLAVIGPRWYDLLKGRAATAERDYVREEIAEAIRRRIPVVPIRVGREGSMPALPRPEELPEDIRELVLYQKHDVAHERFGRDMAELNAAIVALRKATAGGPRQGEAQPWGKIAAALAGLALLAGAGSYAGGWWGKADAPSAPASSTAAGEAERKRVADLQAEIVRRDAELAKAETERKRIEAEAIKLRADADARRKADEDARAKATKAEESERQRLASLKEEGDRQRAAAEAKRKADEEAARRDPLMALTPGSGQSARDRLASGQPCAFCPEMVVVPASSFTMGSSPAEIAALSKEFPDAKEWWQSEGPQRRVSFARPFAVGRFAVTFDEWDACVTDGGCNGHKPGDQGWGRGNRPVINVNWNDAKAYAAWLSRKTGKTYRLLSEAEREYVARAGTTTAFWWGPSISTRQANYDGNYTYAGSAKGEYRKQTMPVDSFSANPWGLFQVHGNVYDWTEDCWHGNYQGAPTDGSAWTTACTDGSRRVVRGGSWSDNPQGLRSANRDGGTAGFRNNLLGFRLGRTLTP